MSRINCLRGLALIDPNDDLIRDEQGSLDQECLNCGAKYFANEARPSAYTLCCHKGKVLLERHRTPPKILMDLYTLKKQPESEEFLRNIRAYNSSVAFASMNCKINEQLLGSFPYCFRIHGQVYHAASTLHPPENRLPRYSQLYIFDSLRAEAERTEQARLYQLDSNLLWLLHKLMLEINPLSKRFRMMRQVEIQENMRAVARNSPPRDVFMLIRSDRTSDVRRFNPVSADEIAAIFTSEDGTPPSGLDYELLIHPRPSDNTEGLGAMAINGLHYIQRMNPNSDPMIYPLLFPFGEQGWRSNIPHRTGLAKRTTVTPMEYYSYRLQIRESIFPIVQYARKLFHQYIVDAYTKMEGYRLDWLRNNQTNLRVELYQGLHDYVDAAEEPVGRTGRRYILPTTFIGSPRAMQQNFQDAMAIVRELGKPDLFITVTCNPKWPEIISSLLPGQKPVDRPDIICRVFNLKLKKILSEILKGHIFGTVTGYVYTIEFQKRGLPHAHILLILQAGNKVFDADGVDSIVCAEIPSSRTHPNLYNAVVTHMTHGPCGVSYPSCPCMENGVCTKNFPKDYVSETRMANDAFPIYKRRQTSEYVMKKNARLDNQWVVPYNKYLLLKFNAHINVEVCASINCVKYIYKYIYKGFDCANVEITNRSNEILNYVTGRYVSAAEGIWRIYGYKMHNHSHTIVRLALHQENLQPVVYHEGLEEEALERTRNKQTHLTAWFILNQNDVGARRFLYQEIPIHYRWDKQTTSWIPRIISRETIGRLYFASPRETERFFLRVLLLHIPGATSFENLRTHNGVLYSSYKEAAIARGLASSDSEWERSLSEASVFSMPRALRILFTTICAFCNPTNSLALLEQFIVAMSEDYHRHHSEYIAREMCLHDINEQLKSLGLSNSMFGLPEPNEGAIQAEEMEEGIDLFSEINDLVLNEKQQEVYIAVIAAVRDPSIRERCFFVDGPGGSGKTTLYKKICHTLTIDKKNYLCVASTGIAATLLPNGRTAHSVFKMPLNISESSVSSINYNSKDAQKLREADLIVWDEATMASGNMIKCASKCVADVCNSEIFFGRKVVLLGGDFRQCLPVVRGGSQTQIVENCLKNCDIWNNFRTFSLTYNMRANLDAGFAAWLLKIGNGDTGFGNTVKIPLEFISSGNLIEETFGSENLTAENMKNRCILSPKNDDILKINEQVLDKLSGEEKIYFSVDTVDVDGGDDPTVYSTEFLNSLTPSGMPPHRLRLKIGCIVVLLRNLNPVFGLCNGSRLMVLCCHERTIVCSGLHSPYKKFILPRIELAPSDIAAPFTLRRRQFPVRLAYAMTINKSQGQTFDKIGLNLPKPVFSHGQLYVALSRVRNKSDIKILMTQSNLQGLNEMSRIYTTKNIVFKEILTNH